MYEMGKSISLLRCPININGIKCGLTITADQLKFFLTSELSSEIEKKTIKDYIDKLEA